MSNNTTASCGEGAPFDDVGMRGLKVVTILSALLSVAGSTFIMLTWRLQRGTRRSLGMHIIFCLSLADFASSLVFIIDGIAPTGVLEAEKCGGEGANSLPGLCMLLAALSQFTGLAAILWTACIAVGLHLGVLRRSKLMTQEPARLRRYMHAAVWGAESELSTEENASDKKRLEDGIDAVASQQAARRYQALASLPL